MIRLDHVSKSYGSFRALSDVTFTAQAGRVTGFVGPNGAGKSTALRALVGLIRPDSGAATIAGRPYAELPVPGRVAGVLLDADCVHRGRTGRETLILAADAMGVPRAGVNAVLERVGLTPQEAKRRVGAYSLGMRQRLGLAQALLGDPVALVLDEPVNGLDPQGIRWMRTLLREYADRGGTVLLSSHLLGELQEIADDLVLLSGGRVVAAGATGELLQRSGSGSAVVRGDDEAGLAQVLRAAGFEVSPHPGGGLSVAGDLPSIGRAAFAGGHAVTELTPAAASLEEFFFTTTADTDRTHRGAA